MKKTYGYTSASGVERVIDRTGSMNFFSNQILLPCSLADFYADII